MAKTVTINQDKLLMLKEALNEFMVDKSSNFVNHDAIFFILYRGDLLFFDEKNKKLLDNFFDRHYDELSDFIHEYNVKKFSVSSFYFSNFMDWIGARVPYLITGYISNQKDVYITANESYDVLNSNELYQLVKRLPNCNIYLGYKLIDKNKVLGNKGQSIPDFYYHGTVIKNVIDILKGGIKPNPEDSLYKIKHDKTVFITSSFEQAKWYANFSSSKRGIFEKWAIKPCVLKIDASKIDSNKIVYDYDVYNMHKAAKDDSIYNDRMKELNLSYKNSTYTIDDQDPRKFLKVGYRGIIMPNAIVSVYLVDYTNKNTEIPKDEFIEYAMKMRENVSENVELDKYEIGTDGDDSILGGDTYHVNESTNFDSSEIGAVNYSWDFDEEEYQEWLEDTEYENTQESLMEYINDNVEFELEYLDNETYHTCGTDYVDYNTLEDMFGSKMQNEILTTCMNDGSGSFETVNLYADDDVDVNNKDSINNMAMKLLRHGDYFKDCRGFILTNGVVVYTESEHNEICRIPNINNKFDFIRMGNIRVLPQSIDIGDKPTSEQRDVLRRVIASYADEELYLDIYQGKNSIGAHYIRPDWRYVMGEIDRFYSEGVRPQGNEFYESKNARKQIVENKYDDLFNKANYDLQHFLKQGKEKYGTPNWYISSWMEKTHPEINVDPKDIKTYIELSDKLHKITKLWNDEDNKEENEKGLEQPKENYDIISLAIEKYGVTSRLSQAGYILPDGKLLNFGSNGYRQTDHRNIEGVYKQNNIKIWDDEYRYNYVVDFMNHGAIRCDVNTGILDMTQEPTNEQFYVIRDFVRKAVDVDIDFTDDKGNTLHSVSYSDVKPQAVVADIMRYYEDGIKPMGNVQYESKNMNNSHLIIESQESKSIAQAKRLVMQKLNYNEQQADEFVRIKLRNDIPTLRTLQGGKFILGATRMFCDGELRTANDIGNLNSTLKLVASDVHINEYDRNLNGLSFNDLIQRFAKAMSDNLEAEKAEVNQMTFDTPSEYEIVRIDSFEQAEEYGQYVSWCVTHDENMFNSYTNNGINQFYFCLKNGFESIKAQPSEGCPLDEYGLSMVAVSVNENGMLNTCTCRWNHDNGGDDSIMNAKQISEVIGMNFFEVFKSNGKWNALVADVKQRLANGEDIGDVFDDCDYFSEDFAVVELNNKWNFISNGGEFLSKQWFDDCGRFKKGFARVVLNDKWNFINKNGELISKQWFDGCYSFSEGFGRVLLNNKWNLINKNGEFLSEQWFDDCYEFHEGFARVKLNDKWNFINGNGELLSRQGFDDCFDFNKGFARVKLNDKWNFINENGELLSEQWFDYCCDFHEGFAAVRLNDKYNFVNKNVEFLSDQWFDYCSNFRDGFADVGLNNNTYKLDTRGNLSLIESNKKIGDKNILIESQESKSIAAAKKLVMQKLNYNEQQANEFIRVKLRNDIPILRTPQGAKFILGAARMFCDGELRTANDIGNLNSTLKLVASDAHINEYDRNLNGLSFNDLIQRFAKAMSDNLEAEKAEVGQMQFNGSSDYQIVRIDSFEEARKYGKYTSWCVTHQKKMFDSYTSDGINQFYFCLKNGFENVEAQPSEGCPLDEYGLSMIAVSVNENGMLSTCTCRWNHDNGGNDSIMNTKQISEVIGMNFFEVFKPNGKWNALITNVKQRLANGEDFNEVFDCSIIFVEGLARVVFNDKYNFINKSGDFLSKQWFDYCYDFYEGFAMVKLNRKYNFINKNGELLSEQWFNSCGDFSEGFARVVLNNKWNFINKNGELLSEQWFYDCDDFNEGFARVWLNGKCNFINKNCEFLSEQWFDECYNFSEGFGIINLNDKENFINKNGELISKQWFDECYSFSEGFGRVLLNNKWNLINKNGEFLSEQWFEECYSFYEGFARVKLNNKWNLINKSGEFLSKQWFDSCSSFNGGVAKVELNWRYYYIDKNGKIKSNESKMNRKNILVSESQLKTIKENFDFEVNSSDIDLSSFKKRHELVPNIWRPSGKLDSRIRLKLLDIADDFWQFVNITWVKPKGIILTGSICNFNWSQYSDIDLHLIVDFDEIDDKTEFVRDYLDAKKNEWNNEHDNLQIMGYKVELYVQDSSEEAESNGIYDLEADEWIKEPDKDDIEPIALNKYGIKDKAAKIMTIIDDMYDTLVSTDDSHIIEQIGDDASYLWKKIKEMRKNSLEKDGEMGSGNVVYKYLRRKFYLDKLWNLRTLCYDKSNSITESKKNSKKYTVYVNGKKDDTFSDMNWKRNPKVGKGFYYGGAVFKIKKVTDDSVYAIEESKSNNKEIIREYLEKNNNLPLYKYYKWAKTASSCEKARDLAYSCCYYIDEYIKSIYYRYSEFENLLDDGKFNYVDEEKIETFCKLLEENNLCDHFISIMQDIVNRIGLYNELPSWCHMDFNRIVKNEWCIHFTKDAGNIVKYGFTGGTEDIDHLAYTDAGQEKPSAGYNFAFLINDRNVDYNEYGDEAVIFRTSGVEIYHYGDNENQVIFWGPNVKNFIPIHQENGDWVVYGENGQVLVRKNEPSKIAIWATENLPQYRKQIMTGKNGYIPKHWVYDKESGKMKVVPYPIYKNESIKKYIKLLKENLINEETVADGSSEGNPYSKRWKAEREALKNFVCNYGTLMQSKEDDKSGRVYKVLYDKWISQLIGYNYALCVQWDEIKMKPKSIVYIRAMDRLTPNIRKNVQYDTRGRDNQVGTNDDVNSYGNV